MIFTEIFNEEIINEFKVELKKIVKSKSVNMFTPFVIGAYEDILDCIEKGSINDIEELEDYIEEHYYRTEDEEPEYYIICALNQFADGDFDSVQQIFKQATLSKQKIDIEALLLEDGDDFDYDDDF